MDDFERAKQLFFQGLQLLEARDFDAAETKLAQSLELIPDRVSTLTNLSAIKNKLKKFTEAEQLARKAIALEEKSPEAWSNLGTTLMAMERHEEALQACGWALNGNQANPRAWLTKATVLLKLKRYDEALIACDEALRLDSSHADFFYTKSLILKELNRPDESQKIYRTSLEMNFISFPVFIGERRSTQIADVLIVNDNPVADASLRSFDDLHLNCLNYPGQLGVRFINDFHFNYIFTGKVTGPPARTKIPQPDLVINNRVNGELILSEGNLLEITDLVDSFGVPVVNHPNQAIQTTRDASAKLIQDIPDVLVPKTMRFSAAEKTPEELVCEIEHQFNYPLITRTLAVQEGKGMTKVDSQDALIKVLSADLPKNFFVTEFVDSRGKNKFFRKIRASIVNREIIINRVDCDTQWNVHTRKSDELVAFYLENSYLLDEEKQLCGNPEAWLGKPALQALRMIRERIPLDVFGVDFDVDTAGRLIFYEANATMLLFNLVKKEVQSPQEQEDLLKEAFRRYFMSLVNR